MKYTPRVTHHAVHSTQYDIYLVGVGGQGVLTIGEIIAETAHREAVPVNLYPTKGMAQRGGFVKAQLRLGRKAVGANIPEKGADLVIAMEVSEALKAVRFIRPGGDFLLFGYVWAPAAVTLGRALYPALEQVLAQITQAGGKILYLDPADLPLHEGAHVPPNIFVLGAALGHTSLDRILAPSDVAHTVRSRWTRGTERNAFAFQSGLDASATKTMMPR